MNVHRKAPFHSYVTQCISVVMYCILKTGKCQYEMKFLTKIISEGLSEIEKDLSGKEINEICSLDF